MIVERTVANDPMFRIIRDDQLEDSITKLKFYRYDDAYDELERFYGDLCCSDERIEYSIIMIWFSAIAIGSLNLMHIALH